MGRNRLLTLVVSAVMLFGTAACSSDGDDTSDGSAPAAEAAGLTKAEFIAQADAICKAGSEEIDALSQDLDPSDADAIDAFFVAAAENTLDQIAAVRALGLPESDAAELDAAMAVFEKAFADIVEDPAAAEALETSPEVAEATETLEAFGLTECGQDG